MSDIYVEGYTNVTNIIADFVENICFHERMPEHRWQLTYPINTRIKNTTEIFELFNPIERAEIIAELKEKIINERRATISTTYTPPSRWVDQVEVFEIAKSSLKDGIGTYKTKYPIYNNTVVELRKIPEEFYLYQNQNIKNVNELSVLEFTADYDRSMVQINIGDYISDEEEPSLSNVILKITRTEGGCSNRNGTVLILVDENFDIKLYMRPYMDIYRISDNIDGLEIQQVGNDIHIKTTDNPLDFHSYYLFWYNTMGNTHDCLHVLVEAENRNTGEVTSYQTKNYNQPKLTKYNLIDLEVDTPLPLDIYNHDDHSIQYADGLKILPIFTLDTELNTMKTLRYIYTPGSSNQVISPDINAEAPDPNLVSSSKSITGEGFVFEIRYQIQNNKSYTWYVSLMYPKMAFTSRVPKYHELIPRFEDPNDNYDLLLNMGEGTCAFNNGTIALILNENDELIVKCLPYTDQRYHIADEYKNIITLFNKNGSTIRFPRLEQGKEYKVIFINTFGNSHPNCSGSRLYLTKYGLSSGEETNLNGTKKPGKRIDQCRIDNTEVHLIQEADKKRKRGPNYQMLADLPLGESIPYIEDDNGNPLAPILVVDRDKATINFINKPSEIYYMTEVTQEMIDIENEKIDKLNKEIEKKNKELYEDYITQQNYSYFVWQFGKDIDEDGFIKQYKNTDSPVFACFFHNLLESNLHGYDWMPINYYITWDEKGCAFMMCEDPVTKKPAHGFAYFGALKNFNATVDSGQSLLDDYEGNFGSFGNGLLEDPSQEVIIPEFSANLTPYENVTYDINVYIRLYVGNLLLDFMINPIISFIDSEILFPASEVISNITDAEELLYKYTPIDYWENFSYRPPIKLEYDGEFYNYYIEYEMDIPDPNITPLPVDLVDKIELWCKGEKIIQLLPIININPSHNAIYEPILDATKNNNNVDLDLNLVNDILTIKGNNIVDDSIVTVETKVKLKMQGVSQTLPVEQKDIEVVIWDFAIITITINNVTYTTNNILVTVPNATDTGVGYISFGMGLQGNVDKFSFSASMGYSPTNMNPIDWTAYNAAGHIDFDQDVGTYTLTIIQERDGYSQTDIFTITITNISIPSQPGDYLRMFSDNPNNVTLSTIKTDFPEYSDYWYWIQFNGNVPSRSSMGVIGGIDTIFYKGVNDIRLFQNTAGTNYPTISYHDNLYRMKIFKLAMDSKYGGLNIPQLSDYDTAISYMNSIGITNAIEQHEIFLTYQLRTVNFIANRMSSKGYNWNNLLDKRFSSIAKWLDRDRCYVFDWFSWEPAAKQPTNGYTGGFSTSPLISNSGDLTNIVGHINIEPEASLFLPNSPGSNAEHIAFPYRWKITGYTPNTGWASMTRWKDEMGIIDPLTTDYGLSNLLVDTDAINAFAILDVVIHEMGHALCNYNMYINPGQPRKGYTSEWLNAGGWKTTNAETYYNSRYGAQYWSTDGKPVTQYYDYPPGPSVSTGPEPATSQYGGSHPLDDWAECYACYILNEKYLKDMFPKKYNIIKNYINSLHDLKLNFL